MTEPTWTSTENEISKSIGEDVDVSSPINSGEGRNIHVTYLVTTGGIEVRRRYSDFQWLYNRLLIEVPGALVPIIPHKHTAFLGEVQYSEAFTEERKINLRRFMKGVFQIPQVKKDSPSLKVFLITPDEKLDATKRSVEASDPKLISIHDTDGEDLDQAKRGIKNILAKAKTVTRNKLGDGELLETKEEEEIRAIKGYTICMEQHVKDIVAAAGTLIKSTNDKLLALNKFGVRVAEWKFSRDDFLDTAYGPEGRVLDDHAEIPKMMSAVAHFSAQIENLLSEQQIAEAEKFEGALQRMSLDVQALKVAIKTRKKLQVSYTAKQEQIKRQQKLIQTGKRDAVKLLTELSEYEKESSILQVKFEECSDRLTKETKRARPVLENALKDAIRDFAKIQMVYGEKIIKSWSTLMPKLLDEGDGVEIELTSNGDDKAMSTSGEEIHPAPSAPPPPVPEKEENDE